MGNGHIFPRVFAALSQRPGRSTNAVTLARLTDLEAGQVARVINHARHSHPWFNESLTVVRPGREWIYTPVTTDSRTPEDIVKENEVGTPHIWKKVLDALMNSGDDKGNYPVLHKSELADKLGLTEQQIINAMNTILRNPDANGHVDVIWRSQSWRYNPRRDAIPRPAPATKEPHSPVRERVLKQLTSRPGDVVYLSEIMEGSGLTRTQVQNAMHHVRTRVESLARDIEVISPGNAWCYRPNRGVASPTLTPVPAHPVQPSAPVIATPVAPTPAPTPMTTSLPFTTPVAVQVKPQPPVVAPHTTNGVAGTPARANTKRLFEEIGATREGNTIVRDDEGTLYSLTEL